MANKPAQGDAVVATDESTTHRERGFAFLKAGKLEEALAEYRALLHTAPNETAPRQAVARILTELGRKALAVREYQILAGLFAAEGLLLRAISACKNILALDPSHTETQTVLADLYGKRADRSARIQATIPSTMGGALATSSLSIIDSTVPFWEAPEDPAFRDKTRMDVTQLDLRLDPSHLPQIPLLSSLDKDAFIAVILGLQAATAEPETVIIQEGERGDAMYILARGEVRVVRQVPAPPDAAPTEAATTEPATSTATTTEQVVATIPEGNFFGEMALVSDAPRVASVIANTVCELLILPRQTVDELSQAHPHIGATVQQFYQDRLLANLMRSSALFSPLSNEVKHAIAAQFEAFTVPINTTIIQQGRPTTGMYMILRGRCTASRLNTDGSSQTFPSMAEGDVFGEISLLTGQPATATVTSNEECILLHLKASAFNQLLLDHPVARSMLQKLGKQRLERTKELASPLSSETQPAKQEDPHAYLL